jgi:hypothetical protein
MDKVHKPGDSQCYAPSSEAFTFYKTTRLRGTGVCNTISRFKKTNGIITRLFGTIMSKQVRQHKENR